MTEPVDLTLKVNPLRLELQSNGKGLKVTQAYSVQRNR